MSAPTIAVLIVEDHQTLGQLMSRFLREHGQIETWAVVTSAEEALEKLAAAADGAEGGASSAPASIDGARPGLPDLLLIDVSLGGMSGIALVGEVAQRYPDLPCLIVSAHRDPGYVQQALNNGARGYVAKGYPDVILEAVNRVLRGEIFLSEELRKTLGL